MALSKKAKISLSCLGFFFVILLAIPFFIDLNTYKRTLESQIKEHTGLRAKIEGDLSLFLIPQPKITINKVSLLNDADPSHKEFLKLDSATVSISWLPLIHKKIDVTSVHLAKPILYLKIDKEGKNNWDFLLDLQKKDKNKEKPKEETLAKDNKTLQESKGFDISLPSIVISEGHVIYDDKGTTHQLENIHLQVNADRLIGPFFAKGSFLVYKKAVNFKLDVASLTSTPDVPVEGQVTYDQHHAEFKGKLKPQSQEFQGFIYAKMDRHALLPDMFKNGFIELKTTLDANPQHVVLKDLLIISGKENLKGDVAFDPTQQDLKAHLQGLPGKAQLETQVALAQQKGYIDFKLDDPEKLARWLKINVKDIPKELLTHPLILKSDVVLQKTIPRFHNLVLKSGDKEVQGSLNYHNSMVQFDLKSPRCDTWLKLVKVPLKGSGGPLQLRGEVEHNPEIIHFKMNGLAFETTFNTHGTYRVKTKKFDIKVEASHPNANQLLVVLDKPQNDFYLGPLSLKTQASGTLQSIHFHTLDLKFKPRNELPLQIKGDVDLGTITTLRLNVDVGHMMLDALQKESQKPAVSIPEQASALVQGKKKPSPASKPKWSHDKLDLAFLNQVQADIQLKISRLSHPKLDMHHLVIPIKIEKGQLSATVNGQFFKGNMKGSLNMLQQSLVTLNMDVTVNQASMEQILSSYNIGQLKGGKMDVDIKLKTFGNSMYALMNHLEGSMNLEATGGSLTGGLFKFAKGFDLGELLTLGKKKKEDLVSISAKVPIHKGVLLLERVKLKTPVGSGKTRGEINLGQWTLNTLTTLDARELGAQGDIVVKNYGSLDDPQTDFKLPSISPDILRQSGINTVKNTVDLVLPGTGELLDKIPGFSTPQGKRKKKEKKRHKHHKQLNKIKDLFLSR